jgi:hypothetical protein
LFLCLCACFNILSNLGTKSFSLPSTLEYITQHICHTSPLLFSTNSAQGKFMAHLCWKLTYLIVLVNAH